MAAPVVGVGLRTINDAEATTGWTNITGGGGLNNEGDYYVQGSFSVSRTVSNTLRGFQYTGGSSTFASDEHAYIWMYLTGYPAASTTVLGGLRLYLSDGGTTNRKEFYVDGNENITGGWRCYVATPFNTGAINNWAGFTNTVSGFGAQANITQAVGKANLAVDVVRVGTGLTISRGESTNPARITSITSVNDSNSNQYGVFAATDTGARLQGRLSIGIDDASTDTYFEDANRVISVPNKNPLSEEASPLYNTLSNFTGIKVQGGLTTCIFTNFTFISADRYDKGYLDCASATNDPGNVDLDGCVFARWGPTSLSSNTTATNTIWINSEGVTLNSGVIDNCTVETGVGGTYIFAGSTPDNISNTTFIGGGTGGGHGIEVTAGGSYTFDGNLVSGFGAENTDDAFIHVNGTGIAVTFNISGGGTASRDLLTAKVGSGSTFTAVSSALVNITGLPVLTPGTDPGTEIRVFDRSTGISTGPNRPGDSGIVAGISTAEIAGTENHYTSTFSFSVGLGATFDVRILNERYVPLFLENRTADTDPTNIPVDLKIDRVFFNPS